MCHQHIRGYRAQRVTRLARLGSRTHWESGTAGMSYLWWLTLFVFVPQAILLTQFRILLRYWRTLLFCILWSLAFGAPWDIWAVNTKIWTFPDDTNVGLWVGIPLEEYLFIVFVTLLVSSITLVVRARLGKWLVDEQEA